MKGVNGWQQSMDKERYRRKREIEKEGNNQQS
jgi:hypothetical protein